MAQRCGQIFTQSTSSRLLTRRALRMLSVKSGVHNYPNAVARLDPPTSAAVYIDSAMQHRSMITVRQLRRLQHPVDDRRDTELVRTYSQVYETVCPMVV